jgi:hypothetical protein
MKGLLVVLLATGLVACALPDDQGPGDPDPIPEGPSTVAPAPSTGDGSAPVLGSPSAAPEPESTPETDPDPEPDTSTPPPDGSGCREPYPPELLKINVAVLIRGPNAWTLDATPVVGPDPAFCAEIGFTDGRANCPVRPEGHPERQACEAWVVGVAVDTGRPGPTWRRNGVLCTGAASDCANDGENQYLVRAMGSGLYTACARNDVCGEQQVDR